MQLKSNQRWIVALFTIQQLVGIFWVGQGQSNYVDECKSANGWQSSNVLLIIFLFQFLEGI